MPVSETSPQDDGGWFSCNKTDQTSRHVSHESIDSGADIILKPSLVAKPPFEKASTRILSLRISEMDFPEASLRFCSSNQSVQTDPEVGHRLLHVLRKTLIAVVTCFNLWWYTTSACLDSFYIDRKYLQIDANSISVYINIYIIIYIYNRIILQSFLSLKCVVCVSWTRLYHILSTSCGIIQNHISDWPSRRITLCLIVTDWLTELWRWHNHNNIAIQDCRSFYLALIPEWTPWCVGVCRVFEVLLRRGTGNKKWLDALQTTPWESKDQHLDGFSWKEHCFQFRKGFLINKI